MSQTIDSPVVHGLEFHYDDSPQRSPQWLAIKRGRIGASKLDDWLSTSKAAKTLGQPLKKRLDYEKELMFERQFNTNFEHYQNSAMQDGVDFEDWAARQYEQIKNVALERVGVWYNEWFAASPDRKVAGQNGAVEIKIFKDNSFTEVLAAGAPPEKYWRQIQGQLWATSWEWVDFVPVNFNSRKLAIIRVYPDKEFHEYLALSVQEKLVVEQFKTENVFDIVGEVPVGLIMPNDDNNSDVIGGNW